MSTFRVVTLPVLALTAVCALVAGVLGGGDAVLGAVIGGVVVAVFLSSTMSVLEPITKSDPTVSLLVAMTLFTGKVAILVVLLAVFLNTDAVTSRVDGRALGLTAIITSLACTSLQIAQYRRRRIPAYDLGGDDQAHP